MTLTTWFKVHAAVTLPFALPMILVPHWFIDLMVDGPIASLSIDLARLVGAAYLLITFLTYAAATHRDPPAQIVLARVFCIYESVGVLVGLTIHFDSHGDIGRWITVGFFGVFALGYLWFGFIEPGGRSARR